ncbi:cytochrome P450 [Flaviflagellibacter deserti]|uniref:Cytochrome P450 n=1 Tax=Flaviflagellibacter deserti TaxID=2267266 RepID=A0ABV9YYX5_9HYPH
MSEGHEFAASGEHFAVECFVQEVRRFYPFFPVIGGRARVESDWRGDKVAEGDWVLLDLYGTNHDARLWQEPDRFKPDRFENWPGDAFSFVAQGAGYVEKSHRCPGEAATIAVMKRAVRVLTKLDYTVPDQDLSVPLGQVPTKPVSGFVIQPF